MRYTYDESGVTFFYFVLSVLAIGLVPATVKVILGSKKDPAVADHLCPCSECRAKHAHVSANASKGIRSWKYLTLIALGWAAFAYVTHGVLTTEVELKIWDPFEVLELDPESTPVQIKKHYKVLSLKWHPDKYRPTDEEDKKASEERFVDITKAYKVLTDDETRKNYEEYGHPDGKQSFSLGIGLPAWLVEGSNGNWVLLVYGLLFGLLMPYSIGRWWARSKQYTKDQIQNRSMALYFREILESATTTSLMDVLAASGEFAELAPWRDGETPAIDALQALVRRASEEKPGVIAFTPNPKFARPYARKAAILLHAHFLRVPVQDLVLRVDQEAIVRRSLHLTLGMLQIILARGWLNAAMQCMELSQLLSQSLAPNDPAILQLPHIGPDVLKALRGRKRPVRMVKDLMSLPPQELRVALRSLDDAQFKETTQVALHWPLLEIPQAILKVVGDTVVTPGAIVTFLVKLRVTTVGAHLGKEGPAPDEEADPTTMTPEEADALLILPESKLDDLLDANRGKRLAKRQSAGLPPPPSTWMHAPRLDVEKRPYFWVIFGDTGSNSIIAPPAKVTDVDREGKYVKFQFQAPPRTGAYLFNIFVKSDAYIGLDLRAEMRLEVQDPSVLPEEEVVEDDISEPEEDSIAGQMALMREGKSAGTASAAAASSHSHSHGGKPCDKAHGKNDSDTSSDEED